MMQSNSLGSRPEPASQAGQEPAADAVDPAEKRNQRLKRNLPILAVSKLGNLVADLLLVRLLVQEAGSVVYGIWATCAVLLRWGAMFDLGLARSIQLEVSRADGNRSTIDVGRLAGLAIVVLSTLGTALTLFVWMTWLLAPEAPALLFSNLSPEDVHLAWVIVFAATIGLACSLPASVLINIVTGLQRPDTTTAAMAAASLVAVAAVPVAYPQLGPWALLLVALAPTLGCCIASLILLSRQAFRWAMPRPNVDLRPLRRMARFGFGIFIVQISYIVVYQTDTIVISLFEGPEETARYASFWRIVGMPLILLNLVLSAFYPAVANAWFANDRLWIRRVLGTGPWIFTAACALIVSLAVIFRSPVIEAWTSQALAPDLATAVWMALFVCCATWFGIYSSALNAIGRVRQTARAASLQAILNLGLSLPFAAIWGASGVAAASLLAVLAGPILMVTVEWRRIWRQDAGR